ncbi:MAG: serpin family protein [Candidatus Eremiobacteraeota bacterium]|nr:serpin family protein [Candidatus Eremiobacteraeota bacterium]
MKKNSLVLYFLIFFAFSSTLPLYAENAPSGDTEALVGSNNAFAFSVLSKLDKKGENLFFSPYSISTALAMTYLGARGATADEMAKTLHFTLPPAKLHPAFQELLDRFNNREDRECYELVVANRLWGQKGYKFLPSFLDDEKKFYQSGLGEVDFKKRTEEARQVINKWIEDATKKRIRDLIPPGALDADSRLVLTNAIYFKSEWGEQFEKRLTKKERFWAGGKNEIKVAMMHAQYRMSYLKGKGYQVLAIPYKRSELSMIVVLPDARDGLEAFLSRYDEKACAKDIRSLSAATVDLALPKFTTTSSFFLGKLLKALGMKTPFQFGPADFSGIDGTKLLFISEVIHKAFVDVNEEGTEAAAATAVVMAGGAMPTEPPRIIKFTVDHPFLFLIRENATGSILFMGTVKNPTAKR